MQQHAVWCVAVLPQQRHRRGLRRLRRRLPPRGACVCACVCVGGGAGGRVGGQAVCNRCVVSVCARTCNQYIQKFISVACARYRQSGESRIGQASDEGGWGSSLCCTVLQQRRRSDGPWALGERALAGLHPGAGGQRGGLLWCPKPPGDQSSGTYLSCVGSRGVGSPAGRGVCACRASCPPRAGRRNSRAPIGRAGPGTPSLVPAARGQALVARPTPPTYPHRRMGGRGWGGGGVGACAWRCPRHGCLRCTVCACGRELSD